MSRQEKIKREIEELKSCSDKVYARERRAELQAELKGIQSQKSQDKKLFGEFVKKLKEVFKEMILHEDLNANWKMKAVIDTLAKKYKKELK